MKRLLATAVTTLVLAAATVASAEAAIADPGIRLWRSSQETAGITSCLSGNSGDIVGIAAQADGLRRISAQARLCRYDGGARSLGLEFFTPIGASGVFIRYDGAVVNIAINISRDWPQLTAMCVSAAPADRLACRAVRVDGAGNIVLSPISVTDPLILPAGPMSVFGLRLYMPDIDPTCATCVC